MWLSSFATKLKYSPEGCRSRSRSFQSRSSLCGDCLPCLRQKPVAPGKVAEGQRKPWGAMELPGCLRLGCFLSASPASSRGQAALLVPKSGGCTAHPWRRGSTSEDTPSRAVGVSGDARVGAGGRHPFCSEFVWRKSSAEWAGGQGRCCRGTLRNRNATRGVGQLLLLPCKLGFGAGSSRESCSNRSSPSLGNMVWGGPKPFGAQSGGTAPSFRQHFFLENCLGFRGQPTCQHQHWDWAPMHIT